MGFGGNTPCVEVRHVSGLTLILDGGSGIRRLGTKLLRDSGGRAGVVHLLLTHFHWDHIQGIPFFAPLYHAGTTVHFYATEPVEQLHGLLGGQMMKPYFPVGLPNAQNFYHFIPGEGISIGDVRVTPIPLRHSDKVSGYRLEAEEGSVVYGTDHEHGVAEFDEGLIRAAANADILIYDSHYTPEEYPQKVGWGHSTWSEAVRVATAANVKRLILFHHAPERSDAELKRVVLQARKHFKNTDAAREGWQIEVAPGERHRRV
jgi:phosphoribosyl 1,2-cyclic phosphodiesterase